MQVLLTSGQEEQASRELCESQGGNLFSSWRFACRRHRLFIGDWNKAAGLLLQFDFLSHASSDSIFPMTKVGGHARW